MAASKTIKPPLPTIGRRKRQLRIRFDGTRTHDAKVGDERRRDVALEHRASSQAAG